MPLLESLPVGNPTQHPRDLREHLGSFVVKVDFVPLRLSPNELLRRGVLLHLGAEQAIRKGASALVGFEIERCRKCRKARVGLFHGVVNDLAAGQGRPRRVELDLDGFSALNGGLAPGRVERRDERAVFGELEAVAAAGENERIVVGFARAGWVEEEEQRAFFGTSGATVQRVIGGSTPLLELVLSVDRAIELEERSGHCLQG